MSFIKILRPLTLRSPIIWVTLLLVPFFFVIVGVHIKLVRGPYWLGSNYDPDYAYLMNALNIIEDLPIGLMEHPGTPVQVFSAWMVQGAHLFRNNFHYDLPTLETDVLIHPELYLQIISYAFLIINTLLLIALGVVSMVLWKKLWVGLILQASPFLVSLVSRNSLAKVAPEALLLTVSLMTLLLCVATIGVRRRSWRFDLFITMSFGIVIALGVATKISFFPMIVLPLFIVRTISLKFLYAASSFVFFLLFTLPIAEGYPKLLNWLATLFYHSGKHGTGAERIVEWPTYWINIKTLLSSLPYSIDIIFVFVSLTIISIVFLPQRRQYLQSMLFRVGIGAVVTQLIAIAIIAKHMAFHYFLPFVPLTGIIIVCALLQLREFHNQKAVSTICLSAVFVLFMVQSFALTFTEVKNKLAEEEEINDTILASLPRRNDQLAALRVGNDWARGSYTWELSQLYPE